MARKRLSPEQIITMLREAEILLNQATPVAEAKVLAEGWRKELNRFRPHGSLGYRPPAPEAFMAG